MSKLIKVLKIFVFCLSLTTLKFQCEKIYKMGITCFPIYNNKIINELKSKIDLSKIQIDPKKEEFELFKNLCRIPSTYIKFLESKNIKFMPIFFNNTKKKVYLEQMDFLDGILMTGGTIKVKYLTKGTLDYRYINENPEFTYPYLIMTDEILKKAKEINDSGRVFLIYGVCHSFYSIIESEVKRKLYQPKISNNMFLKPIFFNFVGDYNKGSQLKEFLGEKNVKKFETGNNAFFFHNYGVVLGDFVTNEKLINNYYPVAIFKMDETKMPYRFIAAIEHKRYPIFALQFHPEKILYETSPTMKITQTDENVKMSKLFADFIYMQLEKGAEGAEIPENILRKFSCPRFLMKDAGIFSSAFIYDCDNIVKPILNENLENTDDY